MKALSEILLTLLQVWHPQRGRLLAGLGVALGAALAGLLLMSQAGQRLGQAVLATGGAGAGYLLLRFSGVGRILLRYFERLLSHDAMFRALADLRLWFYRRLAFGSAAGLGFRRSGDLMARLVQDVQTLDGLYLRVTLPFGVAYLTFPVLVWFCWQVSAALVCLEAGIFLIVAAGLPFLAARMTWKSEGQLLQLMGALQADILELTGGLREIRIFGGEKRFNERIKQQQEELYALQARLAHRLSLIRALTAAFESAGIAGVLLAAAGLMDGQPNGMRSMTALFICLAQFGSIRALPQAGAVVARSLQAARRVVSAAAQPNAVPPGTVNTPAQYDFHFKNVTFGWVAGHPVLKGITFQLPEGSRTALLGASGAGKSTVAALSLKVVMPWQGQVKLGDVALDTIRDESLRHEIGWLSQNTHLFADTIRNNLLLGQQDIADRQLWEALEQAQLAEFVRGLPDGLETWIGENGSRLSGGQGRRLALARVLLARARILIFDEPTSGLDPETARAFLHTLNNLPARDGLTGQQPRTILLILHALTGIEGLDQVLELTDGHLSTRPCQNHGSGKSTP
ncbi:thiol reductant ABC exporter subunit CydC [Oecophyllibacter saccharovorans]|uniref:thiol reductant ABC exporter subunit CydC n=1 Tax=Oecophyllibacter saccharovorans TaxID=2558360 RepID=UPI001141DAC3|nr:thiol reductant ABC exporter subunit CydC [Oecophyllibacter saccharovorans]QDH15854.1 thiol reductant ABC exporter subunit CydC [Oecophyllibacter saccharovorans]